VAVGAACAQTGDKTRVLNHARVNNIIRDYTCMSTIKRLLAGLSVGESVIRDEYRSDR